MGENPYRSLYHCIEKCFQEECVAKGICLQGIGVVVEINPLDKVKKKEKNVIKVTIESEVQKRKGDCKKNFRSGNCTNHKVCHLLGQCMKEHPLIKDNEKLKNRLSGKFMSTKNCVRIFEEIMPNLKRMNYRKYFKPDIELSEEL